MRKLTLALSTAVLALSGAAVAQNASVPQRTPPADMTRAQAQAKAEAAFVRMDANKDGTLNEADRAARKAAMFDRIDTDKNGSLSRAEFAAMQAKRGGEGGKARGGHRMGRKGGDHGMMGAGQGPTTRQAFVDRALTMFDTADANRDGTVTVAERQAARQSMRQQWQARKAAGQQG